MLRRRPPPSKHPRSQTRNKRNSDRFRGVPIGAGTSQKTGVLSYAYEAAKKRSRAISGEIRKVPMDLFVPTLIDNVHRDFSLDKTVKIIGPVLGLTRVDFSSRTVGSKYYQLKGVNNVLTLSTQDTWVKAFNKNCKAFGPISRNRHFRYVLKIITLFGCNKRDIRNLVRLRDLWLRNSRDYKRAIMSFIWSFPDRIRIAVSSLPRKEVNRRR